MNPGNIDRIMSVLKNILIAVFVVIFIIVIIEMRKSENVINREVKRGDKYEKLYNDSLKNINDAENKASEYAALYLEEKAKLNIEKSISESTKIDNDEMKAVLKFIDDAIEMDCVNKVFQKKKNIKLMLKKK